MTSIEIWVLIFENFSIFIGGLIGAQTNEKGRER